MSIGALLDRAFGLSNQEQFANLYELINLKMGQTHTVAQLSIIVTSVVPDHVVITRQLDGILQLCDPLSAHRVDYHLSGQLAIQRMAQ